MSDYSKLLSEFSNLYRVKLLFILSKQKASLNELKEQLSEISHSEISRHLGRLSKQKMIQKEKISGRKFEITHFGKTIISVLGPLDFIFHYNEYFKNHRLDDIPLSLRRGIDALENSEFIEGTGNVMFKMQEFIEAERNEIWIMCENPFPFKPKAKKINLIIPPTMLKHREEIYNEKIQFKVRIYKEIPITIGISENGMGSIFFPNILDHNPDYSKGFFLTDTMGLYYLKSIWTYFWEQGKDYHPD